ncbi:hypothetical protein MBANPS3_005773 [Mucor bainieri]
MKKVYEEKLNGSPPVAATTTTNSAAEAMRTVGDLLDRENDVDELLFQVQLEKSRLTKQKLPIVINRIEDTQLWREAGDEQELTFYRRFAGYLDTLLVKTGLNMIDKETGSASSRIVIETNKQLFHVEDLSSTYARKIDLILRYNDRKDVDLCSNEWKRSKVATDIKLKQQSKNLRINASILIKPNSRGCLIVVKY